MAIDDNTLYGLTGAQVKELPEKIEAVKGMARELTTDDYNYPTSNPNGIAPWLLDDGIYTTASGVQVYRNNNTSTTNPTTFVYSKGSLLWMEGTNSDTGIRYSYLAGSGAEFPAASGFLLKSSNTQDNLTSTSTTQPLSANQGRVLDEKIPAVTLTSTDPGEGATLAANNFIGVYDA